MCVGCRVCCWVWLCGVGGGVGGGGAGGGGGGGTGGAGVAHYAILLCSRVEPIMLL